MGSENVRGIAAMLAAVGAFSLMDAGLKVLSPHYPPLQVTALRGLSTLPIVLAWAGLDGGYGQLVRVRFPLQLLRGALAILMLASFTFALRHLPLADAYAIFFIAPLLITALAAPLLGERVEWQRWAAIAVGLGGVVIVLRPTGAGVLTLAGLAVVAAAAGYALSAIAVRVLGRTDSTQSMVFWAVLALSLGGGALALPDWRPVQDGHWATIAGIGVTGALGQYALTEAFRRGEASVVAPFEYTALAWGVSLDWWLWRTPPGALTLLGAAVVVASGIFLLRRERTHAEAEHP
jgi:drug/metabolite transporter (DMT)-like permease